MTEWNECGTITLHRHPEHQEMQQQQQQRRKKNVKVKRIGGGIRMQMKVSGVFSVDVP